MDKDSQLEGVNITNSYIYIYIYIYLYLHMHIYIYISYRLKESTDLFSLFSPFCDSFAPTFPTLSQDAGIWEKDLNRLGSEMSWGAPQLSHAFAAYGSFVDGKNMG